MWFFVYKHWTRTACDNDIRYVEKPIPDLVNLYVPKLRNRKG